MYKKLSEIKNYEEKKKRFIATLAELNQKDSEESQNIKSICRSIGIDETEVDDMIHYLQRGQVIESDSKSSSWKLSMYGELLYRGKIDTGYAPL